MLVNKILKVILLLLGAVFIVLHGYEFEVIRTVLGIVMFMLLTVLYFKSSAKKSKFFLWFLALFTVGNIVDLVSYYWPIKEIEDLDYFYYLVNAIYITAYVFLIIKILSGFNFKKVFSEFSVPIIILILLDVFCVVLVTDTAQNEFTFYQYILEFSYNAIIMILLSVALINYMYRNDNKSMLFLIASIFIFFSEIIQLAYFYILDDNNLSLIYSLFFIIAFIFFYLQSQKQFTGPIQEYSDEELGT
jgi:hypothetical protein